MKSTSVWPQPTGMLMYSLSYLFYTVPIMSNSDDAAVSNIGDSQFKHLKWWQLHSWVWSLNESSDMPGLQLSEEVQVYWKLWWRKSAYFGKPASLYLISFVSIFVMLVQLHWHWYTGKIIMHAWLQLHTCTTTATYMHECSYTHACKHTR